jgi:RimJ/RimL family protein N-acetyltransferase
MGKEISTRLEPITEEFFTAAYQFLNDKAAMNARKSEVPLSIAELKHRYYDRLYASDMTLHPMGHEMWRLYRQVIYAPTNVPIGISGLQWAFLSPDNELCTDFTITLANEYRGRGIGTEVIDGLEKLAIDLDIKYSFARVNRQNIPSQRLFTKNGYVEYPFLWWPSYVPNIKNPEQTIFYGKKIGI